MHCKLNRYSLLPLLLSLTNRFVLLLVGMRNDREALDICMARMRDVGTL